VLAGILVSIPSEVISHAGPAVTPVEVVFASPVSAVSKQRGSPTADALKPDTIAAKPIRELARDVSRAPARTAAYFASHEVPVPGKKAAKAEEPRTQSSASTSPPSDIANTSAHELDLVRQHLERFKFYPESARRRGIGGDVDVGFRLTEGGHVTQLRIAASSGYALLDETAEAIVTRAAPFPVDMGQYRVRLRFWP
jgi:periplasmic protein TonB